MPCPGFARYRILGYFGRTFMAKPEHHIVHLLQTEPASAVAVILEQYGNALYGLVRRMIPEQEIAEEVIQDVMVKVWQNASSYDPGKGKLFTWLSSIAWNTSLDRIRSAGYKHMKKSVPVDSSVYEGNMSTEMQITDPGVERAIARLDEKYRQVIDMVYFGGYSHSEISEALDIPIGTVKSRVRIAIRELRVALSDVVLGMILLIVLIMILL